MSRERSKRHTLPPAEEVVCRVWSSQVWLSRITCYAEVVGLKTNFEVQCYPGEDDLTISHAILLYLSLGNRRDANQFLDEITKQVEQQQLEFPRTDLMQFIIYLLPTMQRNSLPLFNMLRANYKAALDREPAFHELLEETAEKFYNVWRRNPLKGIF